MLKITNGRSNEHGQEELEMQVTGSRTMEDDFGKGKGSPRTVMPEEDEENH